MLRNELCSRPCIFSLPFSDYFHHFISFLIFSISPDLSVDLRAHIVPGALQQLPQRNWSTVYRRMIFIRWFRSDMALSWISAALASVSELRILHLRRYAPTTAPAPILSQPCPFSLSFIRLERFTFRITYVKDPQTLRGSFSAVSRPFFCK